MLSTELTQLAAPDSTLAVPKLRPYQIQFIREVYDQIRAGSKRILGVAPTGAGKTCIAAQIVQHAVSKQNSVLFVVHRDTLVSQTNEEFSCFGINAGFIKSGWEENRKSLVQIASVQTLWSPDAWAIGAIFGDSPTSDQQSSYRNYLLAIANRLGKPESWIQRYMKLEFGFNNLEFS